MGTIAIDVVTRNITFPLFIYPHSYLSITVFTQSVDTRDVEAVYFHAASTASTASRTLVDINELGAVW